MSRNLFRLRSYLEPSYFVYFQDKYSLPESAEFLYRVHLIISALFIMLAALDELRLRESTCVIFSSDHGELAGEHKQYYKMCLYEPAVPVPLIIAGPGVRAGVAVDAKVKAYDRAAFRQWRARQQAAGTYEQTMARIYSGWNVTSEDQLVPWTEQDERQVERWLDEGE